MRLRTGFLIFNYLLTALGLHCLSFSRVYSQATGLLLAAGLAACFILEIRRVIPVKPPVKILFSSGGLLALPLLHFGFDLPLLPLLVWTLILLIFSRLIFKSELNDYLFGYLLAIVCLLIGAVYIHDLTFAFLFFAFYLALCWGTMFYNMMAERVGRHSPPGRFKQAGEKESATGSLFGFSAGLMILSLAVTVFIFMGFPRLGTGFGASWPRSPISGFSETVRLGDVGRIKQNAAVVMRVEYSRDGKPYRPRLPVFWRGVVLDHFDGIFWQSTARPKWRLSNSPGTGARLFPFPAKSQVVQQNIYMDAIGSDVIFTQGVPLFIDGNFWRVQIDPSFAIKAQDRSPGPKTVTLISDLRPAPQREYDKIFNTDSKEALKKFLQLPPMSARITHLANTLTQTTGSEETKAQNILGYLADNYSYTLDLGNQPGQTGLDHFLFTRKEGHCEYFASAMVVLLRLAGVPARLVNGFIGEEWNDLGEYMVIRQQHAHSWVEAYLPGKGWTVYDPTPPDPAFVPNRFNDPMSRALDLLRLNWQRYIVRFSMEDQEKILERLAAGGKNTLQNLQRIRSWKIKEIQTFLKTNLPALIFLSAAGLWLLTRGRWSGLRCLLSPRPVFPVWLYREMIRKLEKTGVRKQPHWTHREFLNRLPSLPQEKLNLIRKITGYYEKSRFGHSPVLDTEKKELLNCLRKI